jgi:hypothetical protein
VRRKDVRILVCSVLAGAAMAGASLSFVHAVNADVSAPPQNLHIDAQEYAATTPVDPYQKDTAAIHAGVAAGQETARSYLHIETAPLIGGPVPTSVLLTMTPTSDAAGNANGSSATLQACPLKKALEPFNPSSPPAFDCTNPVHGKLTALGTWTFELAPLVQGWLDLSNRGLAIVADHPPQTAAWAVAFDKSKSRATASVPLSPSSGTSTDMPVPPPIEAPLPPPVAAAPMVPSFLSITATTPPPAPTPTPSAASAAGAGTHPAPPPPAPTGATEPPSTWLWWLLGAILAAAAVALAIVVQRAMRDVHGLPDPAALFKALRHPELRLFPAGAVLMIGITLAVGFSNRVGVMGGSAATNAATANGASGSTGGAASSGGASGEATAAPGATGAAAAQGAAAAAAAAAAAQRGAAAAATQAGPTGDIPGVTPTTIRIGFMTETNRQSANAALGAGKIGAYGDVPAEARAIADWLNRTGGIAGRRVIPVMENYDVSNSDPNQPTAICTKFTQDDHVFSVVDIEANPDYEACYARARTLAFATSAYSGDTPYLEHVAPFVFVPTMPAIERGMQVHTDGLVQQGFFGKTDKLGIMVSDDPMIRRNFTQFVLPRLARAGVTNPDIYYINPYADTATVARDLGTGVTHMHANGDNEVLLFGDSGGAATLVTMTAAKGQNWYPKWGLDTTSSPAALETITEISDELKNAVVVGYYRTGDAESDMGGDPVPASPQEKACVDIYKAAGITFGTRLNSVVAYRYCDYAFALRQASQGLGANLSIQTLVAQATHMGTSYMSVNAYHASFNGHPYGTDGYRMLAFDTGCSCFKYTSPTYVW